MKNNEIKIRKYNKEDLENYLEDDSLDKETVDYLLNLEEYDSDIITELASAFSAAYEKNEKIGKFTKEKWEWISSKNLNKDNKRTIIYLLRSYEIEDIKDIVENHLDKLVKGNREMMMLPLQCYNVTRRNIVRSKIKENIKEYLTIDTFIDVLESENERGVKWLKFQLGEDFNNNQYIYVRDEKGGNEDFWNKETIKEFINKVDDKNIDDNELYTDEEVSEQNEKGKKRFYYS